MLADRILGFLANLNLPLKLPKGVNVMNPYREPVAMELCNLFYRKYYPDDQPRTLILGINPGRFGGGVTGIPFTDPIKLEKECGIKNDLQKKPELSTQFIYQMIAAYGGPGKFYSRFYFTAVSALGFTLNGKNLNYYDDRDLEKRITPFIVNCLRAQLKFGVRREICFCLGEGDNYKFLSHLNSRYHFFERIVPLAHPRFIMQYKRKRVHHYVNDYLQKFG